jgi:glycosyltransferase involved in cell wall biosynthesis
MTDGLIGRDAGNLRVAIVFDHWYTPGGAQNEVLAVMELFPGAPLFTLMRARDAEWDDQHPMYVSFLDRLPFAHSRPNLYLPLMPAAVESLDLRGFDLVISITGTWAKGVIAPPHARHICRTWVPMRYGWDCYHDYMQSGLAGERSCWLARKLRAPVMSYLRLWDVVSANRVDHFVAGSEYVAGVIHRRYRRRATVVYPPVDTDFFTPTGDEPDDYYLLVSRLVPYKRVDLAVQAFNELGIPLKIVGSGSEERTLRRLARPNITFIGKVDYGRREVLRQLLQDCRGFIMPQVEDFGIAAVEAMACGTPVIAFNRGSMPEIIADGITGFLVHNLDEMAEAVVKAKQLDRLQCRKLIKERFSADRMVQDYIGVYEKIIGQKKREDHRP